MLAEVELGCLSLAANYHEARGSAELAARH